MSEQIICLYNELDRMVVQHTVTMPKGCMTGILDGVVSYVLDGMVHRVEPKYTRQNPLVLDIQPLYNGYICGYIYVLSHE